MGDMGKPGGRERSFETDRHAPAPARARDRLAAAIWYQGHPLSYLLLPLSWLYCGVVRLRRFSYRRGWWGGLRLPVPVILVGNLTVGGTGKTPLVLWLAEFLRRRGAHPGIVARGYGGTATDWPQLVGPDSDPFRVGDEPVLLARRSGCPVAVGPDRVAAAQRLLAAGGCDIILGDDGLQHYHLARDLEILVVDASRGFGNGRCLPAGPLREPRARARAVDLVVCNGRPCGGAPGSGPDGVVMELVPGAVTDLADPGRRCRLEEMRGREVTAVAGIGNPGRFFDLLRRHGLRLRERPYPDHYRYAREDAASWGAGPLIMTEKDAVKCAGFARADFWYLPVEARLPEAFARRLSEKLEGIVDGQEIAGHPAVSPVQGRPLLR